MTTTLYQKYALRWIEEAIGVGVILAVVAYGLVSVGGAGSIIGLVVVQFLAIIALVYSLFGKVERMIYEITERDTPPDTSDIDDETVGDEWSYDIQDDEGNHKVVKVSDGVQTANFVVTEDEIRIRSRVNGWLINNDWIEDATQYLENQFSDREQNTV